jgi:uncharacterized protein (DUF2164 family)
MAIFNFSRAEKDAIIQRIQQYFSKELDQKIGLFEAGFLLTFFTEEIGPYFYNKGLHDAQAVLHKRVDDISGTIDSLEKPTSGR